jgi:hypothetical protein
MTALPSAFSISAFCLQLSASNFSLSAFQLLPPKLSPFPISRFGAPLARLFVMDGTNAQLPVGCQMSLAGHRRSVTQFN